MPPGYHPDGRNGRDCELHAVNAVLSTSVVGLGDWLGMTNATLVRRMARADGILLKPDRPLMPMDAMFAGIVGAARALPDYHLGARLWHTHATVAREDPTTAPELATAPTRRLVSHMGFSATLHATVPAAVAAQASPALQYVVVAVNNTTPFRLVATDLYPQPPAGATFLYRSAHAPPCANDTDPLASGCLVAADDTGRLMDTSTAKAGCAGPGLCDQQLAVWQVSFGIP